MKSHGTIAGIRQTYEENLAKRKRTFGETFLRDWSYCGITWQDMEVLLEAAERGEGA